MTYCSNRLSSIPLQSDVKLPKSFAEKFGAIEGLLSLFLSNPCIVVFHCQACKGLGFSPCPRPGDARCIGMGEASGSWIRWHKNSIERAGRDLSQSFQIFRHWTGGSRNILKVDTAASRQVVCLKPGLVGLTHVLLLQLSVALVLLHQLRTARALGLQFHGHLAQRGPSRVVHCA
jgi:hypothetical protein